MTSALSLESGSMLRSDRAAVLLRLLAQIAHEQPALRLAVDRVAKPVQALAILGAAAPGALADMPWKGQVLRAVLEAQPDPSIDRSKARERSRAQPGAAAAGPGLLHMGELVITALAAIRVGVTQGVAGEYLDRLFELALCTGVAEALLGLAGSSRDDVLAACAMLEPLCDPGPAGEALVSACTRSLGWDPAERARWSRLVELFDALATDAKTTGKHKTPPRWVGSEPGLAVQGLEPRRCLCGELLELQGSFADAGELWVVFAAPDGDVPLVTCAPLVVEGTGATHGVVTVPRGTRPGWIGVLSPAAVEQTNAARAELRERWTTLSTKRLATPVPIEHIAALDPRRSLPPWPQSRPFDGGDPTLVHASAQPRRANPGDRIRVEWEARGSDWVEVAGRSKRCAIAGSEELELPRDPGPWTVQLEPVALSLDKQRSKGEGVVLTVEPLEPATNSIPGR